MTRIDQKAQELTLNDCYGLFILNIIQIHTLGVRHLSISDLKR